MYHVDNFIQKIKKQSQKLSTASIITRLRRSLSRKKRILALVALGGIALKLFLDRPYVVTLQGEVMHTPYRIQYLDRWRRNYQEEVDVLLEQLYSALSVSLPDSELSRFNQHDCSDFYFESPFFYPVFAKSKEIYRNTAGAFNPIILPQGDIREAQSVDANDADRLPVDTAYGRVSLDYIVANTQRIKKLKEGVKLDFSGILKGYAIDKIADLLRNHGIECMQIVFGSEILVCGKPDNRSVWPIAIPSCVTSLTDNELQIKMELVNKAVAIARQEGQKLSHHNSIMRPDAGPLTQHTLLAAVVIGEDCKTADAYATAMMACGLTFAQELVVRQKGLAAFLIYEDDHGAPTFYTSPGLHIQKDKHSITLQPSLGEVP